MNRVTWEYFKLFTLRKLSGIYIYTTGYILYVIRHLKYEELKITKKAMQQVTVLVRWPLYLIGGRSRMVAVTEKPHSIGFASRFTDFY